MWKKITLTLGIISNVIYAQNGSIIDNIRNSNQITVGHGELTIPFTYILLDENTPRGFSHDIELVIVKHLKEKLNLPDLKIKYQRVTYNNLFDKVLNGEVDLYCGTTTNTVERQERMQFSNVFFVANTRLLVRKDSGIHSIKDLKGKRVGSMIGSASMEFIRSRRTLDGILEVREYDHEEDIVRDLDSGVIDGFFMSDAILAGIVSLLANGDDWEMVGKPATVQRFSCIMPKGDTQFKAIADEALAKYYASGEIYKLYDKWFMQPVPPLQHVVGFEMSEATRRIYIAPTDKAIGQN